MTAYDEIKNLMEDGWRIRSIHIRGGPMGGIDWSSWVEVNMTNEDMPIDVMGNGYKMVKIKKVEDPFDVLNKISQLK